MKQMLQASIQLLHLLMRVKTVIDPSVRASLAPSRGCIEPTAAVDEETTNLRTLPQDTKT